MATGARPFDLASRHALSAAIRTQPHIPMRQLAPHHPVPLERIIDRLLAKDAGDRFQSAAAVRAELDVLRPAGRHDAASIESSASLAVLPFDVLGGHDEEVAGLAEGLAADISSRLSQLDNVSVAPRTSTRAMSGQPARFIGEQLGVGMVLEGTLQRTNGRVRVTATLVDAAREKALMPSQIVEHAFSSSAQDDIVRDVCDHLAAALTRQPARRYSQEPEAYHAFKRGLHLWKTCFEGGWRDAIDHFQHAIDRDPQFALAHVALANAYNFLGFYSLIKPKLAFAVAARAAERALAIDAALGPAFVELALARFGGEWDWEGSEQAFRRALACDPSNPLAHVHYSWLLVLLGRDDAAFAEAQRGHALAPSSRLVAGARTQTMYIGGRYDAAIELCTECLRFDPNYAFAVHVRGLCYLAKSQRDEAVADLERAVVLTNRAPFYLGLLGRCYGEFGMREEALGLIAELRGMPPDIYIPPQCYVFIYAGIGERERAMEYQEKAYEDGASPFNYLTPSIRSFYALSPHHKKRLDQMRLVL